MNLSFAGCGFLGIYHVGVASCFREYAPHLLVDKIAGASVGSIAACALISNVSLGQTTTDVLNVAVKARSRALGPLHPGFDLNKSIRDGLEKGLPENAHLLCNGRLFISVTRFSDGQNVLLSKFDSRDDLIQALLCSCFIPFYSGIIMPKFHGTTYVDGGFSDNLPVLDDNTVTVSPFAGEHDICPQDDSCNILQISVANTHISISAKNMYRFVRILFPPHPEILSKMCQQGFDDALKFLQRHKLISCTRCMAVQSSIVVSDADSSESEMECHSGVGHAYDDCMECRYRRQMALLDSLPDSVVKAIQEACDQVNKGVINWLFRHKPVKFLSLLGLPYVLPIDLSIVFFCKVWEAMPTVQKELQHGLKGLITLVRNLVHKIETKRQLYSAKFSCQLAVTEFDYTEENVTSSYIMPNDDKPPNESGRFITEKDKYVSDRKSSIVSPIFSPCEAQTPLSRPHRKSYAGFINSNSEKREKSLRRNSMVEMHKPERVLRNMQFGFTFDLASKDPSEDQKQDVINALQSLSEGDENFDVIGITNKALNWERECVSHCRGEMETEKADALDKILEVTSNKAVMAYYYMDDKSFKVTEIYNVKDAGTTAVLPQEKNELKINRSFQCENECIPHSEHSCTITDSFDDKEFDMSDEETGLNIENDLFLNDTVKHNSNNNSYKVQNNMPKRKMSFIFVNT